MNSRTWFGGNSIASTRSKVLFLFGPIRKIACGKTRHRFTSQLSTKFTTMCRGGAAWCGLLSDIVPPGGLDIYGGRTR